MDLIKDEVASNVCCSRVCSFRDSKMDRIEDAHQSPDQYRIEDAPIDTILYKNACGTDVTILDPQCATWSQANYHPLCPSTWAKDLILPLGIIE